MGWGILIYGSEAPLRVSIGVWGVGYINIWCEGS